MMKALCLTAAILLGVAATQPSRAQDDEALREMARKAQDPLGDIRALMTDNTIAFDGGPDDDTTYGFQLQPVYSVQNDTRWNMIARAIVPIIGVEPGVVVPPIGPNPRPPNDSSWGLSDTILQYFFSPKSDAALKWGIGPQVSLRTHTGDRQAGPGWGGGLAGVIFTSAGNWAFGVVAMQHWGEDDFELATVQPIVLYNFANKPGAYVGYNNAITYNWKGTSGNKLTVPLGLTGGKTMLLKSGNGLDLSLGAYKLVERPQDSPRWQLKFGVSYFFN
ncbi:MAG: hypothetical protein ACWGPN_14120 [Gammaproteobacteria bacterium]